MKELNSDDIKQELVLMLEKVDNFFKKNNLKYSITSGTLLGAVRHKGFIPWDDDIDISMLRSDYNKLINILKIDNRISDELYGEGFELQNSHLPFLKIANKNIKSEEYITDGIVDNGYLWIDVFPMDGVPNYFSKLNTKYLDKFLRRLYEAKRIECDFPQMKSNSKIFKIVRMLNYDKLTSYFIKQCSRFDVSKCKYVRDYTWGNTTMPKIFMNDIIEYEFESKKFKGIKNYDEYLTFLYKNYMELPPVEKRVSHGIRAWRLDK